MERNQRTDNYLWYDKYKLRKDHKSHDPIIDAEAMFHTPGNSNTTVTFTILVITIASLFASSSLLENQQAFAANGAGSGGAGSAGGSSHAASAGLLAVDSCFS